MLSGVCLAAILLELSCVTYGLAVLVAGIILFGFWLRVFMINTFQIGKAFLTEYLLRGPSRTQCRAPNSASSCINGFSIQESSISNFRPPTIAVLLLCWDPSSWPAYRPVRFYNYTDCPLVPSRSCVFFPLLVNTLATPPCCRHTYFRPAKFSRI